MPLELPRALSLIVVLVLAATGALGATTPALDATPLAAQVPPGLDLVPIASGLSNPLLVTHAGDGSDRVFIVEQRGTVRVYEDGALQSGFWLDVRHLVSCCGERGLLGLAFAPDFETSGRLYISYTASGSGTSVLARLLVPQPPLGAPALTTLEILLTQAQPFGNHNGGHLAFGPDGYLYLGLGDGGSAGDPGNRAQNLGTLLGKLLRIDVSTPTGYTVPADNPFASGGGLGEIWAYGLRNPWRFSFDRQTGDLWIGDVGQNLIEEIDFQAAGSAGGQNYGWRAYEGHVPFNTQGVQQTDPTTLTYPVYEYNHVPHCSVTGGHVYRGSASASLQGLYLFGDFCSGHIWAGLPAGPVLAAAPVLVTEQYQITSFGEDESGELYLTHYGGSVYRITAP